MKRPAMPAVSLIATAALLVGCADQIPLPTEARRVSALDAGDPPRYTDWSAPVSLGPSINSPRVDIDVAISKDGLSLYFGSNRTGGYGGFDLYVSQRSDAGAPWGPPQNLGPAINTAANEQGPALTTDGHRLYFFSDRAGGFGGNDIYLARRHSRDDEFGWEAPDNVGAGVNTTFNDNLPYSFEDPVSGTVTLYFNSNRPAGPGGGLTDIYASVRQSDGTFGPAVFMSELNSPLRDAGMAIRRDGLELMLASERRGTLGNFDLWVATRTSTSDPWPAPVNLGPVVNTVAGESRLALSHDATTLYIITHIHDPLNPDISVSTRQKVHGSGHDDD